MRVLNFIFHSIINFRLHVLGMLGAIIIASIDSNLKPYLIKLLIDSAIDSNHIDIRLVIILYALMQVIVIIGWAISDMCIAYYNSNYSCTVMNIISSKIHKYDFNFFQNNYAGAISSKISDIFYFLPTIIIIFLHQFISFFFLIIFSLYLLFKVYYILPIVVLIWVFLFLLVSFLALKKLNYLSNSYANYKAALWGNFVDYLSNFLNVKIFNTAHYEENRLKSSQEAFIKVGQDQGLFLTKYYFYQGLIFSLYIVCFIIKLITLHKKNLITSGDFALAILINFKIIDKLYEISHRLRDFITSWAAIDEALKILEYPNKIEDVRDANKLIVNNGEIIFKNVKFNYNQNEHLIFDDKSIIIKAGEKVGLVGYSGSGKSTFVNLILRLYDLVEGQILIDGHDIKEITQQSLRENITIIPQEPLLFHRTIYDNIHYGKLSASKEEVTKAAVLSHAHEFIINLPEGYHTLVGERGVKLSGGQRQRIAIARALLKNAPILILDEATSALDSITEKLIQKSLLKLMENKTTLVIAHRLSTLIHMNRILVFNKGKIIQDGSHKKLISQPGLYQELWKAQVEGFLPYLKNIT